MKRAICLGTNYEGTPNELSWCVKDATDLSTLFRGYGFNVTTLTEHQVSRESFIDCLNGLVDQATSGEITGFILTSSGHGTQRYSPSEPDYYDEALYFLDGIVLDDEVRTILDRLPEGLPNFLFFDHCFSGGMMKKIGGDKIRFVPSKIPIPIGAKPRRMFRSIGNEVYMSACDEGEYSYDAGNLRNGAGTFYLKNAIKINTTFQDWMDSIGMYLPSNEYPQSPTLQCKNENRYQIFPGWFAGVTTGLDDIVGTPITTPPIKYNWFKRFLLWLKKIFS
jgi:hypothetical protein